MRAHCGEPVTLPAGPLVNFKFSHVARSSRAEAVTKASVYCIRELMDSQCRELDEERSIHKPFLELSGQGEHRCFQLFVV